MKNKGSLTNEHAPTTTYQGSNQAPYTAPARYRCGSCGQAFTAWAPAERHADTEQHQRIETILTTDQKENRP